MLMLLITAMAAAEDFDPELTYEFVQKGSQPIERRQVFGRIVQKRADSYLVEIDAPWERTRRVVTLRDDMLEAGPLIETPAMRERRIEEGWAERGYAKVTTAEDETAFVPAREAELAQRARRAGLNAEPRRKDRVPPEALQALEFAPPPIDTPRETAAPSAFLLARRAAQAIVLLLAAIIAILVGKMTLFEDR